MENNNDDGDLGDFLFLTTPMTATTVRRIIRISTVNRGNKSTMQHWGIINLVACGKLESYYGKAPATRSNSLRFSLWG